MSRLIKISVYYHMDVLLGEQGERGPRGRKGMTPDFNIITVLLLKAGFFADIRR